MKSKIKRKPSSKRTKKKNKIIQKGGDLYSTKDYLKPEYLNTQNFRLSILENFSLITFYKFSNYKVGYYKIATEKNPSPRSIFWAIGFLANVYLAIDLGIFLFF